MKMGFDTRKAQQLIANQCNRTLRNMRECPVKVRDVRREIFVEDLMQLHSLLFGAIVIIDEAVIHNESSNRDHVEFVNTIDRGYTLMEAMSKFRAAIASERVEI